MDYRFHPHARSELDDALTYYLKVNPELASDFLSEVESAVSRILQFPRLGLNYHLRYDAVGRDAFRTE